MNRNLSKKRRKRRGFGPLTMTSEDERWLLSEMKEDSDSEAPTLNLAELQKWGVYTSIDELPFLVFENVSVDGNLRLLSKKPHCPIEILSAAWENLQSEFSEAMGGETTERAVALDAEYRSLDQQISLLQILIDAMNLSAPLVGPLQELADEFAEHGYERPFTDESWRDDLRWIKEAAQGLVMQRDMKKREAEELLPVAAEGRKPTRENFAKSFVAISKHTKFRLSKHEITTREFCLYYRDFLNHAEEQKRRAAKGEVQPESE